MTINQGNFIIRILMLMLMLAMHNSGFGVSGAGILDKYTKLEYDYINGQIF